MKRMLGRVAATVGVASLLAVASAAPASAATTNIDASANGTVVTVPSSTNVTLGDTVTLSNTGTTLLQVFGDATCDGTTGTNFGLLSDGQLITLGTFASPGFSAGQTVPFSILAGGVCQPFSLSLVDAAPPPDVPEVPYTIALLGSAAALFGTGFFIVRRRRARVA